MECPHCNHAIHFKSVIRRVHGPPDEEGIEVEYGFCPRCDEVIIFLSRGTVEMIGDGFEYDATLTGEIVRELVYPPFPSVEEPPDEVPGRFAGDFVEAARIVNISPKASAAMSRRVLQDVIRSEFGIKQRSLAQEIDEFIRLTDVPEHLANAVDAVRNIGNFAAHPSKDENTGKVVDVEPGEAEWLIDVLEALFDFAFVQPRRLERKRDELNKKLSRIGKPPMKVRSKDEISDRAQDSDEGQID